MTRLDSKPQVALLHFAGPPGVGGVEAVIGHHALGLTARGYSVRVVAGSGARFADRVEVAIHPTFSSTHPEVLAVKAELDAGLVSARFAALRHEIAQHLRAALAGCAVCIAHNVASLHKNLALTAALHDITQAQAIPLIHWAHDLAWTNPQYLPELHAGYPWDLLRTPWEKSRYVTISASRQSDMATLYGLPLDGIQVIPGGVDPVRFLRLTPTVARLATDLRLVDADALLLYPTRLTRRKNVELALDILAAVRTQTARDVRLLVTGPPGPHNPANAAYLDALFARRSHLGLETSAHFLFRAGEDPTTPLLLGDDDVSSLYHLADALLFTSAQEGFGIPMLEAGLAGLPIFCSDLPPLREIAGEHAHYFDPALEPPDAIAQRVWALLHASPTFALRGRVRQRYRWDTIIEHDLIPLVEGDV